MTASYPTTAAPFTAPGAPGSPRSTAPTERNTIVELQTELAAVEADLIAGRGASASLTARLAVISAAIVTAQAAAASDATAKDVVVAAAAAADATAKDTASKAALLRSAPTPQAAFMSRLRSGVGPLGVTVLGDSTTQTWLNTFVSNLATAFPAWTVLRHKWSDTNQGWPAPTYVQVGTSGLPYLSYSGSIATISTPASAGVNVVSTDIMLRFKFRKTALASGADSAVASQYGLSGNRSYTALVKANGDFAFGYTGDGTTYKEMILLTAAEMAANFTAGVDGYLGLTFDRTNGSTAVGQAIKSTDGITWTTVGTAKTNTLVATLFDSTYAVEIGARNTVTQWDGRIYWVEMYKGLVDTAALAYRFDAGWYIHGWSSATFKDSLGAVWTIAGTNIALTRAAPLLAVMDGAVSGATISYADDNTRRPLLATRQANLLICNFGHNEAPADYNVASTYKTLIDNVTTLSPGVSVVLCKQGPQATTATYWWRQQNHQQRVGELAARYGFGVIDAWQAFADTGTPDTYVTGDLVHPTTAGYQLWADEARRSFGF